MGDKQPKNAKTEHQDDRVQTRRAPAHIAPPEFPNRLVRVFAVIDFLFAWVYLLVFIYVVPPFDPTVKWIAYSLSLALMAATLPMWRGGKLGLWTGISVAAFLLLVCFAVVGLLVASAAYLYGLYGAFGKGATYVTLFAISLVITYLGLPSIFQLSYLLRARSAAGTAS